MVILFIKPVLILLNKSIDIRDFLHYNIWRRYFYLKYKDSASKYREEKV